MKPWWITKKWKATLVLAACNKCGSDVQVGATKTTKSGLPIWSYVFDLGGCFCLKYDQPTMDLVSTQLLKDKVGQK
jgi:hypothetical protein